MTRTALATLFCIGLAACGPPQPDVGASVGTGGPAARVGVEAGNVRTGVSTSGPYARADVVEAGPAKVSVGTGGVAASVGVGPVRLGVGRGGWWRLGF